MFRLVPEVHRVLQHCHACQVKSQKTPVQKDFHRLSVQAGAPFQVWSMDVPRQFRRPPVLADVERCLQQVVRSHTPQQHDQRKGIAGSSNDLCAVWLSLAGSHGQCHVLTVTGDARGFPAGRCPTYFHAYNPQSNSMERAHRDLNTMLRVLCHQHAADWEEVLPAALLALRSAVHESTGVTSFACLNGREPATLLDLVSKTPGAPLAAHTYV